MSNTELRHWGIKGQKWGIRRFQNPDGSLTPAGKKRYDDDSSSKSSTKDEAMRSGKATEVAKFKGQMTNEELQRAVNRINLERQLADLEGKEVQTGVDKFNSVMDTVGKVTNGVEKGLGAYNLVAKIYNSFSSDKKLPVIDGGQHAANVANEAAKKAKEVAEAERKKYIDSLSAEDAAKAIKKHELNAEEIASVNKRLAGEAGIVGRLGGVPKDDAKPATNNDDNTSAKPTSNNDGGSNTKKGSSSKSDDNPWVDIKADPGKYDKWTMDDGSVTKKPATDNNPVTKSETGTNERTGKSYTYTWTEGASGSSGPKRSTDSTATTTSRAEALNLFKRKLREADSASDISSALSALNRSDTGIDSVDDLSKSGQVYLAKAWNRVSPDTNKSFSNQTSNTSTRTYVEEPSKRKKR